MSIRHFVWPGAKDFDVYSREFKSRDESVPPLATWEANSDVLQPRDADLLFGWNMDETETDKADILGKTPLRYYYGNAAGVKISNDIVTTDPVMGVVADFTPYHGSTYGSYKALVMPAVPTFFAVNRPINNMSTAMRFKLNRSGTVQYIFDTGWDGGTNSVIHIYQEINVGNNWSMVLAIYDRPITTWKYLALFDDADLTWLNAWTHLVLTFNGTTVTAYVNGSSVGTITLNAAITLTNDGSVYKPQYGQKTGAYAMMGQLCQCYWWSATLSGSEVTALYNSGKSNKARRREMKWNFNDKELSKYNEHLVWCKNLDEASGNRNDTVWDAPMVAANMSTVSDAVHGTVADFNGTNAKLTIYSANVWRPRITEYPYRFKGYTFEVWANLDSTPSRAMNIFGIEEILISTYVNSDANVITFGSYDRGGTETWKTIALVNPVVTGTWYQLVFVFDGLTLRGYKDGVQVGTATCGEWASISGYYGTEYKTRFRLGAGTYHGTGQYWFDGKLCKSRMWNCALPADAILKLYNGGVGCKLNMV